MNMARHTVIGMGRLEEKDKEQKYFRQDQSYEFVGFQKSEDIGGVGQMKRKEEKKEKEKEEEQIAAAENERVVQLISEDEAFIPEEKGDHQEQREEKECEFTYPKPYVLPAVLRKITIRVSNECDHGEPDNVILPDKKTQDPGDTGKQEAFFQGEV